jgi:hypothetical protein
MFRGRAAQNAAAASASAAAVVNQVAQATTSAHSTPVTVSSPKMSQITSLAAVPTLPFAGGSPQNVEFFFPTTIKKLRDLVAEFKITFSTADASGVDITVMPTPFFVRSVEILCNNQTLETIEAAEIFTETCQWISDQTLALQRTPYNISATGGIASSFNLASASATSQKTWYLSLNSSFFVRMEPYLAGFNVDKWSIKLNLATSITSSVKITGLNTNSTCVATLDGLRLIATEHVLSRDAEAREIRAHESGVQYNGLIRTKFVSAPYASMSNLVDTSVQLSSLTAASAATVFYIRKNVEAITDQLTHYELSTLGMRDAGNSELVITLPAKVWERSAVSQVPVSSVMINSSPSNSYLLSNCSRLQAVLDSGKFGGGFPYTGLEQVQLRPVAALSDVRVVAVSYDYCVLSVQNGRCVLNKRPYS